MPEQKTAEVQKEGPAQVSALGVGDVTPAERQAAITAADGTTAGNQAAINAVITVLETFGLVTPN